MRVRFWGTRGSIPAALTAQSVREKLIAALVAASGRELDTPEKAAAFADTLPFAATHTFGGNSSCVEGMSEGAGRVLLDMGSGARPAAGQALRELKGEPGEFHVLMSHLHWDHIMGFPFFTPAYIPGHRIRIYGCHAELEHVGVDREHGARPAEEGEGDHALGREQPLGLELDGRGERGAQLWHHDTPSGPAVTTCRCMC